MIKLLDEGLGRRAALAAAATVLSGAKLAAAQSRFPSRAVSIVVPIPAGGGTDYAARLIAPGMGTLLGHHGPDRRVRRPPCPERRRR